MSTYCQLLISQTQCCDGRASDYLTRSANVKGRRGKEAKRLISWSEIVALEGR